MSERPTVYIDQQESRSAFLKKMRSANVHVEIHELPVGDVMYMGEEKGFLIERKTTKDFTASIVDNRLFTQCINLSDARKELGYKVYVLLEGAGNLKDEMDLMGPELWRMWRFSGIKAPQVISAIITVTDAFDIPILWSDKPYTSQLYASMLIKRYGKSKTDKKHLYALRQSVKTSATPDEKARYILEGLPGISAGRADQILKEFVTVRQSLEQIEEWAKIKGIGQKIVDGVYEVINHKYEAKK